MSPSSLSQILFLLLYHRLPTGEENTIISHHYSSSWWKSWRSTSPSPLSLSSLSLRFSSSSCTLRSLQVRRILYRKKPLLLKQLVEELEVSLAKSLVTFLSLSDYIPHPVPQASYR
jgi:hypothetical protein